jgi:hypothetical protein
MKTSHTILSAFSLAALAGSAFLGACASDDSSTSTPSVIRDAGSSADATTARTDSGTGTPSADAGGGSSTDSGTGAPKTDGGSSTADAGCASVFIPNVRDAGGLFCRGGGSDGGSYCNTGDICCVTKNDAGRDWNACTANGACSFDAGAVRKFECTQASDCAGSTVCCAVGATEPKAQCNYDQATALSHKGTACKAGCEAGDVKVCNADSDCASGQTCRPTTIWGTYVGTCR